MLIPFVYHPDKSIRVYEESKEFLASSGLDREMSELGWAYDAVGELIPQTSLNFWSGHIFPWGESWDEMQISFNLCLFGFYKQAMVSLRSGLELGLLSVYWNLNDDGHETVQEWLRSEEDTPRMREIWEKLIRHRNFQMFEKGYDLRSRVLALGYLHNYVHTKGHRFSNQLGLLYKSNFQFSNQLGLSYKSNFQTFEEKAFTRWLEAFREVIAVLAICHLVKYPLGTIRFDYDVKFGIDTPTFGGLPKFKVDRLETLIGSAVFGRISEIAGRDPSVKRLVAQISSMPDITAEEVEKQRLEWDKIFIQGGGLQSWIAMQRAFLEDELDKRRAEAYIEQMTAWAREHGYDREQGPSEEDIPPLPGAG